MVNVLAEIRDLNPDAVLLDNMDDALIGVGRVALGDAVAVYSQARIFAKLVRDGFSSEEAETYFQEKLAECANLLHAPVILQDNVEE